MKQRITFSTTVRPFDGHMEVQVPEGKITLTFIGVYRCGITKCKNSKSAQYLHKNKEITQIGKQPYGQMLHIHRSPLVSLLRNQEREIGLSLRSLNYNQRE